MGDVEKNLGTALTWLKHKDGKVPFIYTSHNSQNSQPISSHFKVQTRFPIWHHIDPDFPLIPFLKLIPSILIFLVEDKSIRELLDASIGLQLALVLTLRLFSNSLPHTAIIPTHNTISQQFMLSNTSRALMNTAYNSTRNHRQQSNNLTTSPSSWYGSLYRGNSSFSFIMPPTHSLLRCKLGWSIWYRSWIRHSTWIIQIPLSLRFSHLPLWWPSPS